MKRFQLERKRYYHRQFLDLIMFKELLTRFRNFSLIKEVPKPKTSFELISDVTKATNG